MADSMLVRFDDDVAKELRNRVAGEDRSLNRFVNDAVRAYLDQLKADDERDRVQREWTTDRVARFAVRLADTRQAIIDGEAGTPENSDVWRALEALADCVELLPVPMEGLDPVSWEQFKYSRLNETGSDEVAQEMFAQDWAEIVGRDWKWYRGTSSSDDSAKFSWFKSRRRYGLPVPPKQK